uniref:N-6 Adenine-specific DNA methylase n=1 Tax=Medicago truncatula TaxID=3880 RepID=Q1STQ1_MEDTR|nr:N-6 Adenine-specific DNA methylase [Medicago truncatula]
MPFDWQAELAPTAAPTPAPRLQLPQLTAPAARLVSTPTFAQILTATTSSQESEEPLPQPSIKGKQLSIKISQPIYEKGVDYCKRNLRGRLILNKGDKPYTSSEIHQRLQKLWNTAAPWSLLSLGRGYYEFYFASESDMRYVWANGTTILKPGVLRLFEWRKDFNMHRQKNTHAQVWIRWIELPQEYSMDRTLREISSAVGTPLLIDNATSKRLYGHYTRILVDMDCSKKLYYEILVEREGSSFPVEVVYEWMPDYCTHCQSLGHLVTNCRWLYPKKHVQEPVAIIDKGKTKEPVKKKDWVPLQTNPSGIGSSNAFAALEMTNTTETKIVKNIADNTFCFPLQNVVDHVLQRKMLQLAEPVLTLATNEVQDDELIAEGDGVQSGSATASPVVSEIPVISAEQNIEQDQLYDEGVAANLHGAGLTADVTLDGEVLATESSDDDVIDVDKTSAAMDGIPSPSSQRAEGMTHTNPRIQRDLDLWQKVKDYDRRAAENPPFVQVLSKKQQQMLRKHQFDGKAPYKTRSKGGTSPPAQ